MLQGCNCWSHRLYGVCEETMEQKYTNLIGEEIDYFKQI